MHSGQPFAESFPFPWNPSCSSNATHSCTSSAQSLPNDISGNWSIKSELENQAGTIPAIVVVVELPVLARVVLPGGFVTTDTSPLHLLDVGSTGGGASFLLFLLCIGNTGRTGGSDGATGDVMVREGGWMSKDESWAQMVKVARSD